DLGAHQGTAVADQGVGEAQEHARRGRDVAPGLLRMGAVVDPDTDDALRIRHHRQELDVGHPVIGRLARGGPPDLIERVRRERLMQSRKSSAQATRGIDDAIARYDAECGLAVDHIARELHVHSSRIQPGAVTTPLIRYSWMALTN